MSGSSSQLLRICWLFPGSFHLYGERGNILALVNEAQQLGWQTAVTRVEFSDVGTFSPVDYDIIVSPPGELDALVPAAEILAPFTDRIRRWIDEGGVLFSSGSNVALWGHGIDRLDGSWQPGLGLIDVSCQEREFVTGDDLWILYPSADGGTHEAIGHQIQRLNIYPGPQAELWGKDILYGYGLNGQGYSGPRIGPAGAIGNTSSPGHYHRSDADGAKENTDKKRQQVPRQGAGIKLGNSLFTVMLGPALFVNKQLLTDLLEPIAVLKGWVWEPQRLDWEEPALMLEAKRGYLRRKMGGNQ